METVRERGPKRPSDEVYGGYDKKKLKTGQEVNQLLPTFINSPYVKEVNKRNSLPSILCELLSIFKKSEKLNLDKQDKIYNDLKEDFKVLSDRSCQKTLLDDAFRLKNLKELDRCDKINHPNLQASSITKDSIQNLNKLVSTEKYTTEDVPNKVPLITIVSPSKLFAEIHEVRQTEDESNRKTTAVEEPLTSIHDVSHLSVSKKNVPYTDESTDDISKLVMSTESVFSAATSANSIYNTPIPTSKTIVISNTHKLLSTNNNITIVSENNAHKVFSRTENTFKEQMFEILNKIVLTVFQENL